MKWNLQKPWTIYILQHTHTDIGYTDIQEEITDQQISYIKESIDILNSGRENFKWICEGLWGVEQFWQHANTAYREDFIHYVKKGNIGLSGNYLNMTEIISDDVLRAVLAKAHGFCHAQGLTASSAMTADVNGYSWGFADILAKNGVKNLISFINTYHGAVPFGKLQTGFWWESPKGNRILSWIGEHYNLGNWTGLCPDSEKALEDWLQETERLLPPYIEKLDSSDYPFSFCPIAVSGVLIDNSPPNKDIPLLTEAWNARYGDSITLKMATLDEFFEAVINSGVSLPTHTGDWTDWWADGVASTPLSLKLFRDAQRKYTLVQCLDPNGIWTDKDLQEKAAHDLVMYAEHTWGYRTSVSEPWNGLVNELDARKSAYATEAHISVCKNLNAILLGNGKQLKHRHVSQTHTVINPYDTVLSDFITLPYDFGGETDNKTAKVVVDDTTDTVIKHQDCQLSVGKGALVSLTLKPNEKRILRLKPAADAAASSKTSDDNNNWHITKHQVETPFYTFTFSTEKGGLISLTEKSTGLELIRGDHSHPAFMPIYEVTKADGDHCSVRNKMGMDRRNDKTEQHFGKLKDIVITETGALRSQLKLCYELKGTAFFETLFVFYKDIARFDLSIRFHKDSVWEPENLYLYLPFTKSDDALWIEKTGAILRPGIDQLPGSCIDFYSIQDGMAFTDGKTGVAFSCPDTPMIWLGALTAHHTVYENQCGHNKEALYSWVMNNFWDTNFKASLGGFYEFTYHFSSGAELADPQKAIQQCKQMNSGAVVFRSSSQK